MFLGLQQHTHYRGNLLMKKSSEGHWLATAGLPRGSESCI